MNHNTDWQTGSFCKDGWISYRWNRSVETPYPEHDFEIYLNPKGPTKIVSIEVAAKNVAEDICQTYKNKKLFLAMSGGIDSEYVAVILKKMSLAFIPLIVEIEEYNQLDTWWAHRWCKENKVEPVIIKITLIEYSSKILELTKKYYTKRAQGASVAYYCSKVALENNGVLLGGGGTHELYIPDPIMPKEAKDPTLKNKTGYLFNEVDLIKHLVINDMPIMFFNWNAEITLSYIAARDPQLTTEENRFKLFNCPLRPKIGVLGDYSKFSHIKDPIIEKTVLTSQISYGLGGSDSYYLGTTEYLMELLKNEK